MDSIQPASFPYYSAIPLPEILGEVHGTGAGSRRVEQEYTKLLKALGPELTILLDTPLEAIAAAGGSRLAEGIRRMRSGEVTAAGGYDGEYGVIRLFAGATSAAGTPRSISLARRKRHRAPRSPGRLHDRR